MGVFKLNFSSALVTGGAGFIGSHLVDALMERNVRVTVLDNLSGGRLSNISIWLKNPRFKFIMGDMLNPEDLKKALENCEIVFHLSLIHI